MKPLRIGIGGPVGSGKTALVDRLCVALRDELQIGVVTNDIYTREDAEFLVRAGSLPAERIIAVETGGRTRMVERDSIRFVEASGDYVRLHTDDGAFLVRVPISSLEETWRDAGFVRVHRRYLIALRHVTELRARPGGGYDLLVAGQELPVSRRHARELRDRLARSPGTRPRKAGS